MNRRTYRVYFNRALDWPQCWSIDEGSPASEINVVGFEVMGGQAVSKVLTAEQRAALDSRRVPFAWLEVVAVLTIADGWAFFS